ncbi:MAG: DNA-binding protein AraC-type [Clostridia bacterium]|nr:DNA-binding protein AraC-type [Clostridia bacterium]
MNIYVNLINEAVDYIEENIHERMSLEDIAKQLCVSKFHFNRMFKTVSGMTLKQYVLGRKLTKALCYLIETGDPVIDAAYRFGFEYPEVFSRAFKKHFGVSPSACQDEKIHVHSVEKINIIDRDIINYKGTLALNGTDTYVTRLQLEGTYIEAYVKSEQFKSLMQSAGEAFLAAAQKVSWLDHTKLYAVVSCHEEDNGEYTVFYGMQGIDISQETNFEKRDVPEGWYAKFVYHGDMFDIRETFVDDLYRWIMVKEIQLNLNGVGMLNIFEEDYLETSEVQILVPIKKPLSQQETS